MKTHLLLLGLFIPFTFVTAQDHINDIRIVDPQQNPWHWELGTIEEATFSIRPKGVFAEVDVDLTFSDRGSRYNNEELLEVQFRFSLPDGAVVTDSWLWVEEDIVKATLIDRWTASEIYEGIVNRRRDPSLLVKHGKGEYELRIYPMPAGTSRRVKITYLVPVEWTTDHIVTSLPFEWLRLSANPLNQMYVLAWPGEHWKNPFITESPDMLTEDFIDERNRAFTQFELGAEEINNAESISFSSPMKDGVFLSSHEQEEQGWYQLAYLPSAVLEIESNRKVLLVIDNDATRATLSSSDLVEKARSVLKSTLSPSDSFNVVISQLEISPHSGSWVSGEDSIIDAVFDELSASIPSSYSNLPSALAEGIAFLQNQEGQGEMVLISASDGISDAEVANQIITDLQMLSDPLPPIHIVDVAGRNVSRHFIGSRLYEGNAYLYINLSRISGGQYLSIRAGRSYEGMLREIVNGVGGDLRNTDLYTTVSGGFTFGRFTSVNGLEPVPLNRAISQVGNFIGSGSFTAEISGFHIGEAFSSLITFDRTDVIETDSALAAFWTGQHIEQLENEQPTNELIANIIENSMENRVLSLYTAFLALEPGLMGTEICEECLDELDEVVPIGIEEELPNTQVTLEAFPNPFSSSVTVRVTLPSSSDLSLHTFFVYNSMGQVVKELSLEGQLEQIVDLVWDGTNQAGEPVASGMYFFVMTGPDGRHTLNIVRVR